MSPNTHASDTTAVLLDLRDPGERDRLGNFLQLYGYAVIDPSRAPSAGRPARALRVRDWPGTGQRSTRTQDESLICLTDDQAGARSEALEAGADDCLSRPYEPRELVARIESLQRRRAVRPTEGGSPLTALTFGAWHLDPVSRRLHHRDGDTVSLTLAESRLLRAFLALPRSVLSRDDLMDLARGRGMEAFERSIDLLVSRLRHKLRDDPTQPAYIHTVRGVGYLFDPARA